MAKLYTIQVWEDELLSSLERFNIAQDDGTPINNNVQINLATSVITPGTNIDANKLNHMEQGIDNLDTKLSLMELGWLTFPGSLTYVSADAPSFVANANSDANLFLSLGDKVWLTQTTSKYFIVTSIGTFSGGNTPITLYGGYGAGNFTLANAAISGVYFSKMRTPLGFPFVRSIWDIVVTQNENAQKTTGSANVWYTYNDFTPAGPSINVPIGHWDLGYEFIAEFNQNVAAGAALGGRITLTDTLSTQSDMELTANFVYSTPGGTMTQRVTAKRNKPVLLATKKTYYGGLMLSAASDSLKFTVAAAFMSSIRARCEYL